MAVTFKVPSSPKKDVFEIDNFLGVDLTNTGSNIDEVRSPNAPNMVRYVPGKVRKRTGYKTQVEFSTGTNVNRALGTSEDEQIFEVTNTWSDLYDVAESLHGNTDYYYDFWYCCDGNCSVFICNSIPLTNTEGAWIHVSGITRHTAAGTYGSVQAYSANGCELKIREMSVMLKRDDSYAWRKAPEDDNTVWIKTESDKPIYGCHELMTTNIPGNHVKGVNRIKGTSDEWETILPHTYFEVCEGIPKGMKIALRFEYQNLVCGSGESGIVSIGSTIATFPSSTSGTVELIAELNYDDILVHFYDFTSVEIRKLQLNYQEGDVIEAWSEAPEDSNTPFDIGYVYDIDKSVNLAPSSHYTEVETFTASTSSKLVTLNLPSLFPDSEEIYIEFVLTIGASRTSPTPIVDVGYDSIMLLNSDQSGFYISRGGDSYVEKRYRCIVKNPDPLRLAYIRADFTDSLSGAAGECSITIDELKIYPAQKLTSYNTFKNFYLYHVGNDMYMRKDESTEVTKIFSDMNSAISKSWQIGDYLYIIDGKKFKRFSRTTEEIEDVFGKGYIPNVAFSKAPSGGGISNEPYNMMQPAFIDLFSGTSTATVYQLSSMELDNVTPKVWVMNSQGEYAEKEAGVDFTVNYYEGTIEFRSAPGVSPITGEDNVKIQAYKTISDYADRINKCSIGTLFGVNGESNRLFLSGNPDHKNWDFYSEMNDPTYFPDTGYSSLGLETSAIIGYSKVNNYLATHKDSYETEQNVLVREGDLIKRTISIGDKEFEFSDPAFKLINTIQGAGAIGKHTFGNLQTEPIFLTKSGLYAITAQDLTGEKYGQNRSFYLNGQLLKEENLENAVATVYNDMYILAVNNKLYILDGLQPVRTDKSEPYATRQYVGFYCTDVPANIIFTQDDALWIGTFDGKICRFATDIEDLKSYNDDGKAIYCCWETPDLDGRLFYKNKTFRYFAIRMMKALRTSVALYSQKLGAWTFIKEDASSGVVFDFENIDFELFSFSTDTSEKVVHTKMRVKKVDKARFKVENGKLNEPFGLFDLALEYVESGNYKG